MAFDAGGDDVRARRQFSEKQAAGWQARAALRGVELRKSIDDHGDEVMVATKWALTRELQTADQVGDFLRRMGAAPG